MRHFVIGTSGHIDHGKSTLVLALTGTDPDRLKEEKSRGITIDLGFAHYVDGDTVMSFVDVPGHERFVKNMLAGATGMDAVLLVIAADESVMPQTREHFAIARLLGLRHGVIALTKADLVDVDTLELVRLETRELVAGSFLETAPVVAVSARTGAGLDDLRGALRALVGEMPVRPTTGAFRLPVDRVFSIRGFGTVVTGTASAGLVALDDELEVAITRRRVKVRGLHVHGAKVDRAQAGQRVAMNVSGIELADLARGDTLATPGAFEPTRRFDATLDVVADAKPLKHGARVRVHQGTTELLARISIGRGRAGEQAVARAEVPPGGQAYVRVRLERPAVLARGDAYVVRSYSPAATIAGGVVLDPQPPNVGVRGARQLARMQRLDPAGRPFDAVEVMAAAAAVGLEEAGPRGVTAHELATRWAVAPGQLAGVVAWLAEHQGVAQMGEVVVAPSFLKSLESAVVALLERHHRDEPLSEGLPREEVRTRVFHGVRPEVFEHVLAALATSGRIVDRDRLALTSHRVTLSAPERHALERVDACYAKAGLRPPDRARLEAEVAAPAAVIDRVTQLLTRQKRLVRLDTLYFHADALERLKSDVRALKGAGAPTTIDVGTFKDRYGVTRKFAIPLLEYLDRERITRRMGEKRVVL